jgi:hypothetical protein
MAYHNKNKNKDQSQEPTHEYFSASGMEHFERMGENQVKGKSKGTSNDKVGKLTADTLMNAKDRQGRPLF